MNQEEVSKQPTAEDLAAMHNRQREQRETAMKTIKATERNTICPCGCGNKAKKCPNGRRVLQFKKLMRGSVIGELLVALVAVFAIAVSFKVAIDEMHKQQNATHTVQSKP